jgi:hypothetical protein
LTASHVVLRVSHRAARGHHEPRPWRVAPRRLFPEQRFQTGRVVPRNGPGSWVVIQCQAKIGEVEMSKIMLGERHVSFKLPDGLHAAVQRAAEANAQSFSAYVRLAIVAAIKRDGVRVGKEEAGR